MLITKEMIYHKAINEKTYEEGEKLYAQGKLRSFRIQALEEESAYFYGEVADSYLGAYRVTVAIEKGRLGGVCQCAESYEYTGLCKHMVATLLRFLDEKESIKEYQKKQKEKRLVAYGEALLETYEQNLINQLERELLQERVVIYPKLSFNYLGRFRLSISIGIEGKRAYIVKDIYNFAEALFEKRTFSYGKQLSFSHILENFSKESQKLALFIQEKALEYEEMAGMIQGAANRKILPLSPVYLQEFVALLDGEWVEYDGRYGKFFLQKKNPPLSFSFEKKEEQFFLRLKVEEKEEALLQVLSYGEDRYLAVKDHLYLCERGFVKEVLPLVERFIKLEKEEKTREMVFHEEGARRFIHVVLPKLKKHVQVEMEEELLENYTPQPLKITLYLDRDEEEKIIGQCTFSYGENRFNPYETGTETFQKVVRDFQKEYRFHQLLESYGFHTQKGKLHLTGEEEIYLFLKQGIEDFLEIAEVHVTEGIKQFKWNKASIRKMKGRLKQGLLEMEFEEQMLPVEEMHEILVAYKMKKKYYRLKSGVFIDFEDQNVEETLAFMDTLEMTLEELEEGKLERSSYQALYIHEMLKDKQSIVLEKDAAFEKLISDMKNIENPQNPLPPSLEKILRDYQKRGYQWLSLMAHYRFGGILADDMGLGKTIQVITLLVATIENNSSKQGKLLPSSHTSLKALEPSLVVAPTSLVLNWKKEIEKFAPSLRVLLMTGSVEERKEKGKQIQDYDVILTSYDLLKRDLQTYTDFDFTYCIADEAHYIKNPTTQNAKALKKIKARVCFALTGTPMENTLSELWSLFDFIMPGYLGSYQKFRERFEVRIVKEENEKVLEELRKMIQPFVLRRLKKEVLKELPSKTQTVLYNEMGQEQKKLYHAYALLFKKELVKELQEKTSMQSHIKILALLTRLRQLCSHPKLYLENYEGESAKLNQCIELIEESIQGGHKILLFSQFTSMLEILREEFTKRNISFYMFTGKTKAKERLEKVEAFNEDETSVFLISLKAGGTGLNLTGADIVIHYDPWWNVTSQNQATDRAHRIGQKNNVQVFDLITAGTIEEKIKALQERKIGLSESVLAKGEHFISQMSSEEILELFHLE